MTQVQMQKSPDHRLSSYITPQCQVSTASLEHKTLTVEAFFWTHKCPFLSQLIIKYLVLLLYSSSPLFSLLLFLTLLSFHFIVNALLPSQIPKRHFYVPCSFFIQPRLTPYPTAFGLYSWDCNEHILQGNRLLFKSLSSHNLHKWVSVLLFIFNDFPKEVCLCSLLL